MKRFLSLFAALPLAFFPCQAFCESIVGHWFYIEKIYEGQVMPNAPDAPLQLYFDFAANGESHLYWWHSGQKDHCERWGQYHIEGNLLVDQAIRVNPANTPGCEEDPDMQAGKTTSTAFSFQDGNLLLDIGLSGESLIYVWKQEGAK